MYTAEAQIIISLSLAEYILPNRIHHSVMSRILHIIHKDLWH